MPNGPNSNKKCSTRQGYSLSPLLFALAIEPLVIAIRSHPLIKGKQIAGTSQKISLYVDDILIYLTEPESSIPTLLETLTEYGVFSGYKINLNKSVVMPHSCGKISRYNIPFQWCSEKLT